MCSRVICDVRYERPRHQPAGLVTFATGGGLLSTGCTKNMTDRGGVLRVVIRKCSVTTLYALAVDHCRIYIISTITHVCTAGEHWQCAHNTGRLASLAAPGREK